MAETAGEFSQCCFAELSSSCRRGVGEIMSGTSDCSLYIKNEQ